MNELSKYRILIIEPSQIVRVGLSSLLAQNKLFSVISCLSDLTYFNSTKDFLYDMVLINPMVINYDQRGDIRAIFPIQHRIPIFAISYIPYEEDFMRQYDGCIYIHDAKERIVKKMKKALENTPHADDKDESNGLSSRERSILAAVAQGKTNKEIADEFHISVNTVITHRKNISRKLGINTISGLTVYAIMNKLVDMTDF